MPQSAPAQPARQWHAPLTHWPRPWQLRGQMRVAQSRPDQPSWQRHSPATRHVPWQLERLVGIVRMAWAFAYGHYFGNGMEVAEKARVHVCSASLGA